jgi:hypothetical protein
MVCVDITLPTQSNELIRGRSTCPEQEHRVSQKTLELPGDCFWPFLGNFRRIRADDHTKNGGRVGRIQLGGQHARPFPVFLTWP